jgi:hypothetical protein
MEFGKSPARFGSDSSDDFEFESIDKQPSERQHDENSSLDSFNKQL